MDAQADLNLRWAHTHFVGFVVSRLNFINNNVRRTAIILIDLLKMILVNEMNPVTRKSVFRVFDQVRHKPAGAATEARLKFLI